MQEGAEAAVVTASRGKEVRKGKGRGRKRRRGRVYPCRRSSLSPTPRSSEVMHFPQSDPLQFEAYGFLYELGSVTNHYEPTWSE